MCFIDAVQRISDKIKKYQGLRKTPKALNQILLAQNFRSDANLIFSSKHKTPDLK